MPYTPINYEPSQIRPRIAHIGLGAFHRAHMAWACHELLQKAGEAAGQASEKSGENEAWGICAVSLRGSKSSLQTIAALERQSFRYLLAIQGKQSSEVCEVGSIVQAVDAVRDGIAAVVHALAAPEMVIISCTVTEKGYYIDAATRQLDEGAPDILHDLTEPQKPRSLLGFLTLGLAERQRKGRSGVALMSCDNIPSNSRVLQRSLLRFAELLGEKHDEFGALPAWLKAHCSFPCTMVDRITPAVDEETLQQIASAAGKSDPIALATEEFSQWVIEDDFPASRPAWQKASGVTLVSNEAEVELYEEMKLRMLNGSHSFLAYCGYLAGKKYIFECMADETLRTACYQFICEEQLPTLRLAQNSENAKNTKGTDAEALTAYAKQLIERYSNPYILHRCYQIAMDGSLKIPQRWLDGYRTAPEQPWHYLSFALAAWLCYVRGQDLSGAPIVVQDPNAETLCSLLKHTAQTGREAEALFSFAPTFGDLKGDKALIQKVQKNYENICSKGIINALKNVIQ